jgi:hypothetical protein
VQQLADPRVVQSAGGCFIRSAVRSRGYLIKRVRRDMADDNPSVQGVRWPGN